MPSPKLCLGLGNPGAEYEHTRHNYGFLLIDALLDHARREYPHEIAEQSLGKKRFALWKCRLHPGESGIWFLAKPYTFMNLSGECATKIANFYQIQAENILVAHDELDIPLGRMKIRQGGSAAGHNGIRSMQEQLGTPNFYRLRLGIDKPRGGGSASYVLGQFSKKEAEIVHDTLAAAVTGVSIFAQHGLLAAQQHCNSYTSPHILE